MRLPDITIAVDGFSSTGKSTFAKLIAARLHYLYLDSGAIYRAVTLYALDKRLIKRGVIDEPALKEALKSLKISFKPSSRESGKYCTCIGGRDVEWRLRTMKVSGYVSPIAVIPFVRAFVDRILHSYGKKGKIVMDGRDIGTAVFPKAELKIFMTADDEVRAGRRLKEMNERGVKTTYEEVLENLRTRDRIDSSRKVHPLKKADDAIVLDNSRMTIEEEMVWLEGVLREKWPGYESDGRD